MKYRGNLTSKVAQGVTTTTTFNPAGTPSSISNGTTAVNASLTNTTNFAAPDTVNLAGNSNLQTNLAYSAFLGVTSSTDNGNQATASQTFDSAGRVSTATSVDMNSSNVRSVTTYTYTSSSPFTKQAKVTTSDNAQGRYTTTTFDGFGRTVKVVRTDANGVNQSEVDTTYSATSNAPLGMVTKVTQPYTPPNSTPPATTSTFDGAGNILTKVLPDNSTTSYSYGASSSSNSVTITDPASHWKTITSDILGNVSKVVEPNPAGGNYTTTYGYDWVNHLINVDMGSRDGSSQTPCGIYSRTFTYSSTMQLTSRCEPETGTTSFTYNADGSTHTKTLANGNVVTYTYDGYGRYTGFSGSAGGGETVGWGTNTLPNYSSFSQNSWGRVAYREEKNCGAFTAAEACLEMFSYSPSGHTTSKELAAYNASTGALLSLTASFAYDNEGRMTSITYPSGAWNTGTGPYSYTFDAMGRPTGLGTFGSGAAYNAADQLTQLIYGPGRETRVYNSLNQLFQLHQGAGVNMNYVYNAGNNNGQIAQSIDRAHGQSVMYT